MDAIELYRGLDRVTASPELGNNTVAGRDLAGLVTGNRRPTLVVRYRSTASQSDANITFKAAPVFVFFGPCACLPCRTVVQNHVRCCTRHGCDRKQGVLWAVSAHRARRPVSEA